MDSTNGWSACKILKNSHPHHGGLQPTSGLNDGWCSKRSAPLTLPNGARASGTSYDICVDRTNQHPAMRHRSSNDEG
eukprot:scaffold636688_cov41-Prasinocladus_malaysianus.AAC.1